MEDCENVVTDLGDGDIISNENGGSVNSIQMGHDRRSSSTTTTVGKLDGKMARFRDKFEILKRKRVKLMQNEECKHSEIAASSSAVNVKCNANDNLLEAEKLVKERKELPCVSSPSDLIDEINTYLPHTFTVLSSGNEAKRRKLEQGLDTALKKGDYSLCENLSDQIEKERFSAQVHGALVARAYLNDSKKKRLKKPSKKKLNWAFDQKERWETKGNMGK